jgi:glutamate:GABA antiporter
MSHDGAAPRFLGVINERFGTPVRVNIFSGVVSTIVLILAHQLTSGNAAKFFGAVLGVTISTTLVSYLLIYPALWKLRRSHPEVDRPFKMPVYKPLTVILMVLLAITVVELFAPGAGMHWFGSDFAPDGWAHGERWSYLATEAVPVLVFVLIGVLFWAMGTKTRRDVARVAPANAGPSGETDPATPVT